MDLTTLDISGEWLELETEYEKFGTLRVKVIPQQMNSMLNVIYDNIAKNVIDVVIDWDLESDGKKIECNEANKNKYLPTLSLWKIKNPKYARKGKQFETVGAEIIGFAQKIENFTKN